MREQTSLPTSENMCVCVCSSWHLFIMIQELYLFEIIRNHRRIKPHTLLIQNHKHLTFILLIGNRTVSHHMIFFLFFLSLNFSSVTISKLLCVCMCVFKIMFSRSLSLLLISIWSISSWISFIFLPRHVVLYSSSCKWGTDDTWHDNLSQF